MGLNLEPRDERSLVAALLAESHASAAPADLRDHVLHHIARHPRVSPVTPSTPVEVYGHQVDELHRLLSSLTPGDWSTTASPYEWSIHALVAHLLAVELYTARQLGLDTEPLSGDHRDHLGIGRDLIATELHGPPQDTVHRWHRAATRVRTHAEAGGPPLWEQLIDIHGWPMLAGTALVARGFEIWTHTDDIRRATGQPQCAPEPADLRTMSTTSVTSLPLLAAITAPGAEAGPTRVVLTGAGGGTFDLPGGGARRLTLVVDVVDYCRVASRRVDPATLDATIEGDRDLAFTLLDASRLLAV